MLFRRVAFLIALLSLASALPVENGKVNAHDALAALNRHQNAPLPGNQVGDSFPEPEVDAFWSDPDPASTLNRGLTPGSVVSTPRRPTAFSGTPKPVVHEPVAMTAALSPAAHPFIVGGSPTATLMNHGAMIHSQPRPTALPLDLSQPRAATESYDGETLAKLHSQSIPAMTTASNPGLNPMMFYSPPANTGMNAWMNVYPQPLPRFIDHAAMPVATPDAHALMQLLSNQHLPALSHEQWNQYQHNLRQSSHFAAVAKSMKTAQQFIAKKQSKSNGVRAPIGSKTWSRHDDSTDFKTLLSADVPDGRAYHPYSRVNRHQAKQMQKQYFDSLANEQPAPPKVDLRDNYSEKKPTSKQHHVPSAKKPAKQASTQKSRRQESIQSSNDSYSKKNDKKTARDRKTASFTAEDESNESAMPLLKQSPPSSGPWRFLRSQSQNDVTSHALNEQHNYASSSSLNDQSSTEMQELVAKIRALTHGDDRR